jgi:hypothetical protein
MINVYIFRTASFPETNLNDIVRLANVYSGPLHFILGDYTFNDQIEFFDSKDIFIEMQNVRKKLGIVQDSFTCIYGYHRLSNNYFSMGDGNRNYYIHHKSWDLISTVDAIYPNVFTLFSNILKENVYNDFNLLMNRVHQEARGCYMDFCKNKSEVLLQLRTADICNSCIHDIQNSSIDDSILQQILDAFEGLRKQFLFRHRLTIDVKLSPVEITSSQQFILPDFGNIEFNFSPIRKAIYALFLNHPEGFTFQEIVDQEKELTKLYQQFQPKRNRSENKNTIITLLDPLGNALHESISKINREVERKLGKKIAEHYQIRGNRNQRRKIQMASSQY